MGCAVNLTNQSVHNLLEFFYCDLGNFYALEFFTTLWHVKITA